MGKSLVSLKSLVAVLFSGMGLLGQSASAQAPIYSAADFQASGYQLAPAQQDDAAFYPATMMTSSNAATGHNATEYGSAGYGSGHSASCSSSRGCGGTGGAGGGACGNSLWSASANALFLFRNDPAASVLAFNTINPAERLDASDFNFGMHTGYELALNRRVGSRGSVELRYFGLDHWRATFGGQTTPGQLLQFNAAVPVFATSGTGVSADYGSKLHNAEFNIGRYYGDSVRLLTGFRYLELDEHANASLQNALVPFSYADSTRNRLYGTQVGAQAWLICRDRISWDVVGKAGIYGNQAAHAATVNTGVATLNAQGRGSRAAFVGEIGTNGAFCLTDHLSLRGGYSLLWVDGVAVVSDQLASSDFFTGNGFNGSGSVFYHGATAGLEYAF